VNLIYNLVVDEDIGILVKEKPVELGFKIAMCLLIWVGIVLSHLKDIKCVFWSFIPIQIWLLIVLYSFTSTLYVENIEERNFHVISSIATFQFGMFNSILIG
jgi:hypothetical protein